MTKIEALKKAIFNLENGVYEYDWMKSDKCNCGVLAKTILDGRDASACGYFNSPLIGQLGAFAKKAYCMTTNLPLPEVFTALKESGFSYQELLELEFLGNRYILERMGKGISYAEDGHGFVCDLSYCNKSVLIKYLQIWVQILEEGERTDGDVGRTVPADRYPHQAKEIALLPIIEERHDAVGYIKEKVK